MSQETFINYKSWRWFWITLVGTLVAIVFYIIDHPTLPQSGSTTYGYTLGIICGALMVYLLWYGSRKRRFFARYTTLREVLSAHIWIGLALLVLVPLHCGFRFHWNVHTYTFILCILTIVTGIWGAYLYRVLPKEISSNRGEGSLKFHIEQFNNLVNEISKIKTGASSRLDHFTAGLDKFSLPTILTLLALRRASPLSPQETSEALIKVSDADKSDALKIVSLIDKKFEFIQIIEKEVLVQTWLKLWLYLHVPLACGSVMLLVIHIISVLYFS